MLGEKESVFWVNFRHMRGCLVRNMRNILNFIFTYVGVLIAYVWYHVCTVLTESRRRHQSWN